ncbi:metallophosphoesterase [Sphingomonas sp. YL-JM2C]
MLIAQISDHHIVAPGALAYGRIDSAAMLRHAVSVLNELRPQPSLVICSGDLIENGTSEEYAHFKEIIGVLKMPFLPVMGNHDRRDEFLAAFGSQVQNSSEPFIQYVRPAGDIQIVILDTVTEGSGRPSFCADRARWLDRILGASTCPSFLVTHHPVFPTGIEWMDEDTQEWTSFLSDVVDDHRSSIIGMTSGHIHRAIHTRTFDLATSSCPSTAHQVALDFESPGPIFSQEAPGFQIHRIESGRLTTYTASLERFLSGFDPRQA